MSVLIEMLMAETGLNRTDIISVISNAQQRYKTYLIPKRNGANRVISQPAREVKALQRALVANVLDNIEVHPAAMAYRAGLSIKDNAAAHIGGGPILKFDFSNFFPSIKDRDWHSFCDDNEIFDDPLDKYLSSKIMFFKPKGSTVARLAIGAPSSPMLSNIIMRDFDLRISSAVAADGVTYTRYADDLTFSARRTGNLVSVKRILTDILKSMRSPRLTLNEEKTVLATRKFKRMVTGLVLTNDGSVSIGHDRKRRLRAALHRAERGELDAADKQQLRGMIAFIQSVEPDLYRKIVGRYGKNFLVKLSKGEE